MFNLEMKTFCLLKENSLESESYKLRADSFITIKKKFKRNLVKLNGFIHRKISNYFQKIKNLFKRLAFDHDMGFIHF